MGKILRGRGRGRGKLCVCMVVDYYFVLGVFKGVIK